MSHSHSWRIWLSSTTAFSTRIFSFSFYSAVKCTSKSSRRLQREVEQFRYRLVIVPTSFPSPSTML